MATQTLLKKLVRFNHGGGHRVPSLVKTSKYAAYLLGTLACSCPSLLADTLKIDFGSPAYLDAANSTGLWNTLAWQIQSAVSPGAVAGREINFGDGSDGVFADGPTQSGITINGSTITFDTNTKSSFQFSSFTLSSSKAISVTGSRPLHIRVLGYTSIAGSVSLNGSQGGSNSASGAGSGGSPGSGGYDGGAGGSSSPFAAGTAGSPTSGVPRGGLAGNAVTGTGTDQGGGGACNGAGPNAGLDATNGANNAASAGNCTGQSRVQLGQAFTESNFVGGSGGGGGGSNKNGGLIEAGAGGGGGGGAIHIVSLGTVQLSSTLSAKGGAGGRNDYSQAGDCGGGGGGGSGGSVWLQTLMNIAGSGTIDVTGGSKGTSSACGTSYDGGLGSRGVYRYDTATGTQAPTISPVDTSDPSYSVGVPSGQTYVVTSKALDFTSGYYTYDTPTETTGCGTAASDGALSVTYEGSQDGVTFDKSVSKANISELNNYPYIRFKVRITTGSTNSPPCLKGLSIPYSLSNVSQLTLSGGFLFCGMTQDSSKNPRQGSPIQRGLGDLLVLAFALLTCRVWISMSRQPIQRILHE